MRFQAALDVLAEFPRPDSLELFQKSIDPCWIGEALHTTGTATVRKRRLPAEYVIWLVIGMALYRNRSITDVVSSLNLVMPKQGMPTVVAGAIPPARNRLGESPLQWLFTRSAYEWAHASAQRHQWNGLALYGIDGTTLQVPDSKENRDYFGLASGGHRGESGYPLVRMAVLMTLRSHLLALASFGPYENGEHTYASDLWDAIPDNSLTILDKNFLSAVLLLSLTGSGQQRHWLIPAKSNTKWRSLKHLAKNDELIEMTSTRQVQRENMSLPKMWQARAISYQIKGFRPRTLLTSLVDPEKYPAAEIIRLYHERWEIELGYGEIKTRMMDQTHTPLRSTTPMRVSQEIWGLLIAYNLVRLEIERISDEAQVSPTKISFTMVFHIICNEWLWCSVSESGSIPRHLRELREDVKRLVLPDRRQRSSPRAVKVKMSGYPKKRRDSE